MVDFGEFKKFFLFNLIGSLVISAIVAVITVLVGKFNEVTARVLFTLLMVVIHSLISLAFIWDDERQKTFERLSFFINVLFFIIVVSFITSILSIWKVIPYDIVWKLYGTYFIIAFASLHGNILAKALDKETYMDIIIYINYLFMFAVVLMLQAVIYIKNPTQFLGEVFYRVLAALGIIDGTLSILTIIFYKLYTHKHPRQETASQDSLGGTTIVKSQRRGLSIWVWILIIYLVVQVFFFGFRGILGRLF